MTARIQPAAPRAPAPSTGAADPSEVKKALRGCPFLDLNSLDDGEASPGIAKLQRALGIDPPTGKLDALTRQKLHAWQAKQHDADPRFRVDDKVGQQTWASLLGVRGFVPAGRRYLSTEAPAPAAPDPRVAVPEPTPAPASAPPPPTGALAPPAKPGFAASPSTPPGKPELAPSAARGPASLRSPGQVLASVGDQQVTEGDVQQVADTLGTRQKLAQVVNSYGDELKVAPHPGETPEAYAVRVRAEAKARGRLPELESQVAQVQSDARAQALLKLTMVDVLKTELTRRHIPLPANPNDTAAMRQALEKSVAAQLKEAPTSEKVQAAVGELLQGGLIDALWAPYNAVADKALSNFTDNARVAVKDFLTETYGDALGCLAPERIAQELQNGGPAAKLVQLIASSGKLHWTLADVQRVVADHPDLKMLLPAKDPNPAADPVLAASAPVTYQWSERGLAAKLGPPQPNALLEKVKAGQLHIVWVETDDGPGLSLQDASGKEVQDQEAVQAATDILRGPLIQMSQDVAAAWKAGKPPVADVIRASGLAPYLGPNPIETAMGTPQLAEAIKSQVIDDALSGSTADSLAARSQKAGIPADKAAELQRLQERLGALNELSPAPFDLGMVIQGKSQKLTLPLSTDAKLTKEQKAALTTVQHYLDVLASKAGASPTPRYGELDPETVNRLRQIYDLGPDAKTLDLTPDLMKKLVGSAAAALDGNEVTSGEMILKHPILARSAGAQNVDPTRLVIEYLKAQGFKLSSDPPKLDADLYAALDASAGRPVDENLLKIARQTASQLGPYPPAVTEKLLTGKAFIAGGNLRVFIPGAPATAADSQALAQRLAPLTQPMSVHTVAKGDRGHLPVEEPIVALKLVLAQLNSKPVPVSADGVIDSYLTGAEVRALRDLCCGKDATTPNYAKWSRVADAVDHGQVVIANLDDLKGKTPLELDVNSVLGDLRQMSQAVAMSTIPEDGASARLSAEFAPYAPLKKLPRPMATAQSLMAAHFGQEGAIDGAQQGALNADDLTRLQRMAAELEKAGTPEGKDFVAAFKSRADDVQTVIAALRQGRLTFSSNRVQSTPKDGVLESKASGIADLFLQGGEILQSQARAKNHGVLPGLYRSGLSAYEHAFTLPGFTDGIVFNRVKDWTVVALKSEMFERHKAPDASVTSGLRAASTHVDAKALRAVLAQDKGLAADDRALLERAAGALEGGTLTAWDAGAAPSAAAPDKDAALKKSVDDIIAKRVDARRESMTQVDGDFLKYLVDAHPDQVGRSFASTLISGEPSTLPGNAEAKKLLLRVASKMPPPWDTLNVTLQDTDPDVRTAKALVQEALTRMNGGSGLWGGLVPGRDVDAVKSLVKRLAAMEGSELAPYLKSFCIQQGFASTEDVGGIKNPQINKATLDASILLAKKAVQIWSKIDPTVSKKMEAAQKTLEQAAAKGTPISLSSDPPTPEAKALRDLLESTALSFGSTGGMDPLDFGSMLAQVPGDLKIRHLRGNEVDAAPPSATLADVTSKMGRELPWTEENARALTSWTKHVQFDPNRALQTAIGSAVMFKYLMGTMVGYDLWVTPFIKSGRALKSWGRAEWSILSGKGGDDAKAERAGALSDLTSTWQDWIDLQSQMLAYATPLPFAQELKGEIEQGRLDVAAGKGLVYYFLMRSSLRGMAGMAGGIKNMVGSAYERLTPRKPFEVSGPAMRTEAVALSEAEVRTSGLYRGAVRTGRVLGTAKDYLLDPREGWRAVGQARRWLGDQAGLRRVKIDATRGDFALKLPNDVAQWVADHPNGRLQLTLVRDGKEYELDITNKDLVELAKYKDGAVPKALTERIGLTGRDAAPVAKALAETAQSIPAPTAAAVGSVPKLRELADPGRQGATTTWRVEVNGKSETIELKNGTVAELVEAYYKKGGNAYAKILEKNGLMDKEPLVRAVLSNYRNEGPQSIAFTERPVGDVDRMLLSAESYVGQPEIIAGRQGMLLYKAESNGTLYRVIQGADGKIRVMSGSNDITSSGLGTKVLSSLESLKARYGTTSATQIAQLKQIETESANWAQKLQTTDGKIPPQTSAAYKQWASEVEGRFKTTLSEGELGTVSGRLQLNILKAKLGAQTLQMELRAGGLSGATASIVRGTAATLKGQLKSPAFYLVLAVQGQKFLIDLGDTLNDDSLTSMEKLKRAVEEAAITGGGIVATTALLSLVGKLFPRVGSAMSGVGTALLIKQLASGEIAEDALKAYARLKGEKNPLQAMQMWRALGVPEAGYFKIDPDQHPQASGFGKVMEFLGGYDREVDDIATLDRDAGNMPTPRLDYWTGDLSSPLAQRIRQLCGLPMNGKDTPIQRPQDVDLGKVKSYQEPVWSTVSLLQRLAELQKKDPLLGQVAAAKGFEFGAWHQGVQSAAQSMITRIQLDGAGEMLTVDEPQLRTLLTQNDQYANLTAHERQVLDRKLATEVAQVVRWTAVLNRMGIDAGQKETALIQLVENMASNHRANSILFEYTPKKNVELKGNRSWMYSQIDAPPAETNIDDYYTVTRYLLGARRE